ncbi:hypothetical protein [Streptomyces sp. NPDC048639]|uniref:hypothetical protein n=1 Tax=Streptomyces sp. NPDC048639 TaxID=3365581 RepID=UPI0037180E43
MAEKAEKAETQAEADGPRRDARAERRADRLAKQIERFSRSHGGRADGSLEYIGQAGTRIVLVGEDGAWGDLVATDHATAQRAAEKAGITLHDSFAGDPVAKVRTGPYEWSRMAGIQVGGPSNT